MSSYTGTNDCRKCHLSWNYANTPASLRVCLRSVIARVFRARIMWLMFYARHEGEKTGRRSHVRSRTFSLVLSLEVLDKFILCIFRRARSLACKALAKISRVNLSEICIFNRTRIKERAKYLARFHLATKIDTSHKYRDIYRLFPMRHYRGFGLWGSLATRLPSWR